MSWGARRARIWRRRTCRSLDRRTHIRRSSPDLIRVAHRNFRTAWCLRRIRADMCDQSTAGLQGKRHHSHRSCCGRASYLCRCPSKSRCRVRRTACKRHRRRLHRCHTHDRRLRSFARQLPCRRTPDCIPSCPPHTRANTRHRRRQDQRRRSYRTRRSVPDWSPCRRKRRHIPSCLPRIAESRSHSSRRGRYRMRSRNFRNVSGRYLH
jgi:hypothetical protein